MSAGPEAKLAARVVAWLEDGFEVYQEVGGVGGVADIVAVRRAVPRLRWEDGTALSIQAMPGRYGDDAYLCGWSENAATASSP